MTRPEIDFDGRTVLITGAATGIERATALHQPHNISGIPIQAVSMRIQTYAGCGGLQRLDP
jgi:hypothetical protein